MMPGGSFRMAAHLAALVCLAAFVLAQPTAALADSQVISFAIDSLPLGNTTTVASLDEKSYPAESVASSRSSSDSTSTLVLAHHPGMASLLQTTQPQSSRRTMQSMAAAGSVTFATGQYLVTNPGSGTLSLGYWWRDTSNADISVYVIPASAYATFQSGASFTYYPSVSAVKVKVAALSTTTITAAEPYQVITMRSDLSAGTLQGQLNFINGACVPSTTCKNGGICNLSKGCDCPPGWSGSDCGTAICSAVVCTATHQSCTAPDVCTCQTGWGGSLCSVPICSPACTSGHGTCAAPDVCTCLSGFSGAQCAGIDGGYTAWSLGSCTYDSMTSTLCHQTQTRTCTNPVPSNGGQDCSSLGSATITGVSCTCLPRNGGYSLFGAWGICNGTPLCTQSQSRTCDNPKPANGGSSCLSLGASSQSQECFFCDADGAPYLSSVSSYGFVKAGSGSSDLSTDPSALSFSDAWGQRSTWLVAIIITGIAVTNLLFWYWIWRGVQRRRSNLSSAAVQPHLPQVPAPIQMHSMQYAQQQPRYQQQQPQYHQTQHHYAYTQPEQPLRTGEGQATFAQPDAISTPPVDPQMISSISVA